MGNEIKFKPATFYLGIADHLAQAVEGLESEDVDATKVTESAERGRGKILVRMSDGINRVETKQALVREECVATEVHPINAHISGQPGAKGRGGIACSDLSSGPGHYDETTTISLSTALEVTTSIPLGHKPDSHSYPPQQHTSEPELKDPRPISVRRTTKPHNDE